MELVGVQIHASISEDNLAEVSSTHPSPLTCQLYLFVHCPKKVPNKEYLSGLPVVTWSWKQLDIHLWWGGDCPLVNTHLGWVGIMQQSEAADYGNAGPRAWA